MKTNKLLMGCAVGALLASTAAYAGYKSIYYVGVDTTSREAYGSFGSARSSADTVQYIGCAVQGFSSGTSRVICEARNASNVSAACSSTAPAMVTAATSQSGDSYIYFTWDETGTCTYLYVSNTSNWAPRQP
jgi:hypothetical protein